jgi:hypothetical protein
MEQEKTRHNCNPQSDAQEEEQHGQYAIIGRVN